MWFSFLPHIKITDPKNKNFSHLNDRGIFPPCSATLPRPPLVFCLKTFPQFLQGQRFRLSPHCHPVSWHVSRLSTNIKVQEAYASNEILKRREVEIKMATSSSLAQICCFCSVDFVFWSLCYLCFCQKSLSSLLHSPVSGASSLEIYQVPTLEAR